MDKPKTVAVTDKEGGDWIPIFEFRGLLVHSIKFDDGSEWDCVNGWRQSIQVAQPKCHYPAEWFA